MWTLMLIFVSLLMLVLLMVLITSSFERLAAGELCTHCVPKPPNLDKNLSACSKTTRCTLSCHALYGLVAKELANKNGSKTRIALLY